MNLQIPADLNLMIGFEGMDASYKETNSKALLVYLRGERFEEYIKDKKVSIQLYSFPIYDHITSYYISNYLHGKYNKELEKINDFFEKSKKVGLKDFAEHLAMSQLRFVCNLFFLEMFDWHATTDVDKPTIVILDRYFYSQMYYLTKLIHMEYKGDLETLSKFSAEVESIAKGYSLPDINYLFKMTNSFDNMVKVLTERKNADIYESDLKYLKSVYDLFNSDYAISEDKLYTKREKCISTIHVADKNEEQVFTEIKNEIEPVLQEYEEKLKEYWRDK